MGKYSLAKKTGKNYCDELWKKLIRLKFNSQCPICVKQGIEFDAKMLNAHHLISRRVFKYRWDVNNGILLCPKHHEFDLLLSAHTAPWAFEEWIRDHLPFEYDKWVDNRTDISSDGKFQYEIIYHDLEEQYKKRTGEYYMIKRINMYLLSLHKAEIVFAKKMQGLSVSALAKKYEVSDAMMKKFLATT